MEIESFADTLLRLQTNDVAQTRGHRTLEIKEKGNVCSQTNPD
jgi:hypothetical protein